MSDGDEGEPRQGAAPPDPYGEKREAKMEGAAALEPYGKKRGRGEDAEALEPYGDKREPVMAGAAALTPDGEKPEAMMEGAVALGPDGEKRELAMAGAAALGPDGEKLVAKMAGAAALGPDGEKPEAMMAGAVAIEPDGEENLAPEDEEFVCDLENAQRLAIGDTGAKPAVDTAAVAAAWTTALGRWFILGCIPRVSHRLLGFEPGLVDLRISKLRAPSRATLLIVHAHLAPQRKCLDNYPYIAAGVNDRGRILLCAGQEPDPDDPPSLDTFVAKALDLAHHARKAYIICDTTNFRASRLPDPDPDLQRSVLNPLNAFLLGDEVLEFQAPTARASASILWHKADSGWFVVKTNYPPLHRPWSAHGAVFHDRKVWWIDLSYGLLYGEVPALRRGALSFVALPDGSELQPGTPHLDRRRCVGVSDGALRFVKIHGLRGREGDCVPAVSMWTLIDSPSGGKWWRRECRTPFQRIWDDHSFKSTKLREDVPSVALIHPNISGVVYFFQQSRLLGVDVLAGKVVERQYFAMLHPPPAHHSSQFVRAWHLPRGQLYFEDPKVSRQASMSDEDKWCYRDRSYKKRRLH